MLKVVCLNHLVIQSFNIMHFINILIYKLKKQPSQSVAIPISNQLIPNLGGRGWGNFTRETKQRQKKFDDDVMLENCDIIGIFPIYSQFGVIWKPDSRHIVCKTYTFINSNLLC